MRRLITRIIQSRRSSLPTSCTRINLPSAARYTGYPNCPGLTLSELETHYRLCRSLGEGV